MPITHPSQRYCSHESTVSVISEGLERVICEECGHVGVRYEAMIRQDVDRSQFTRQADILSSRARQDSDVVDRRR